MSKANQSPQGEWLSVSTDGFASINAGREPAHLVKELLQNALDATNEKGGIIGLFIEPLKSGLLVRCCDNGCGMPDLNNIRTVFFTTKTDSHLKRGRMGRGFKEMLCLATDASVVSGSRRIHFLIANDQRVMHQEELKFDPIDGTEVEMHMPWSRQLIPELVRYFQTFLPPANVQLTVNAVLIQPRQPRYSLDASLPTELFEEGRWIRPPRKTVVELVAVVPGEEAQVYELGIPVCPAEWSQPFHINVLQRVPMNPNRDAVASGYLVRIHKACLPILLPKMTSDQVREDWVGTAVPHCSQAVQKQVIESGFGSNLARSVPTMGVRQFDEDARDLGVNVIDTRQTAGGFREVLQQHVPTTRQVVDQHNRDLLTTAANTSFSLVETTGRQDDLTTKRQKLIEAVGGKQRVQLVMDFAKWFCQRLLDGYQDTSICSVKLALLKDVEAVATWSESDELTLGIDTPYLWKDPLGEETFSTLIHEAAHHLNQHHGRDFHKEVEALAGRAARLMLQEADLVRTQFAKLM